MEGQAPRATGDTTSMISTWALLLTTLWLQRINSSPFVPWCEKPLQMAVPAHCTLHTTSFQLFFFWFFFFLSVGFPSSLINLHTFFDYYFFFLHFIQGIYFPRGAKTPHTHPHQCVSMCVNVTHTTSVTDPVPYGTKLHTAPSTGKQTTVRTSLRDRKLISRQTHLDLAAVIVCTYIIKIKPNTNTSSRKS